MSQRLTAICVFIMFAAVAFAGPQNAAQDKSDKNDKTSEKSQASDKAQIVSTAEILKVDAKKQTLQVRNIASPSNSNDRSASGSPGARRPGGGGGGGGGGGVGFPGGGGSRRRTGGGYPYPGGGGGGRSGGPSRAPQSTQAKEYKIYVTKETSIKLANAALEFTDLRVGDRISVAGTPKGSSGDLEATAIVRDPQ